MIFEHNSYSENSASDKPQALTGIGIFHKSSGNKRCKTARQADARTIDAFFHPRPRNGSHHLLADALRRRQGVEARGGLSRRHVDVHVSVAGQNEDELGQLLSGAIQSVVSGTGSDASVYGKSVGKCTKSSWFRLVMYKKNIELFS